MRAASLVAQAVIFTLNGSMRDRSGRLKSANVARDAWGRHKLVEYGTDHQRIAADRRQSRSWPGAAILDETQTFSR